MENYYIQQGDVLIKLIQPKEVSKEAVKVNSRTLAEGETTGHSHAVAEGSFTMLLNPFESGVRFLNAISELVVKHEEHAPVTIKPGNYRVEIVQEEDHFLRLTRNVRD